MSAGPGSRAGADHRGRPGADEYDPFYAGYLAAIDDAPVMERLRSQPDRLGARLATLAPGGAAHRYADDKWSVREVLGHLADTERVFGTRATCIARGETADLPGFEQDDYVREGEFDDRTLDSLLAELTALRAANVAMLDGLSASRWTRRGRANGAPITVRALAWITAGHFEHHLRVLEARYTAAFTD